MFSHFYFHVCELFFAAGHRMLQGRTTKTKAARSSSMLANLLAADAKAKLTAQLSC